VLAVLDGIDATNASRRFPRRAYAVASASRTSSCRYPAGNSAINADVQLQARRR
jgi:hypothetical protein